MLPLKAPSPRFLSAISFELATRCMVIHGGHTGVDLVDETWSWNGSTWSLLKPLIIPSKRYFHSMATHNANGKIVLFGGTDGNTTFQETWEYVPVPGAVTVIGHGCQGSNGKVPGLASPGVPRLGQIFQLSLVYAIPLSASLLFFDVTNPGVGLDPFGAPGCTAYVNLHLLHVAIPTSLAGTWYPMPGFKVPFNLAILGGAVYFQTFIVDPAANHLGVVTSNGLKGVIGF